MRKGAVFTIGSFVIGFILWEIAVRVSEIPAYILPPPSGILVALYRGLNTSLLGRGGYYYHLGVTLYEALFGLAIGSVGGVILGTLVSQFSFFERTLFPWIVAFQALPKIALAPLFVLWFGFGLTSKIVMVIVMTFFPLLINSIAGFKSVDLEQIDMLRSYSATEWQIFKMVKLPNALPYIFAGLDMAVVLSVLGAIVGEFVGAQSGLGALIMQMNVSMDVRGVFSVLIILAGVGLLLHFAVTKIEKKVLFWAPKERTMTGV